MKKTILLIISIVIVILFAMGYIYFIKTVDVNYATNFSKVFANYDINDVDEYLSPDTVIICNGKQEKYADLRENVILACSEKRYEFVESGSHGHGNNRFTDGIQQVNITLYGKMDGNSIGEGNVTLELKKKCIFQCEIKTLKSDEPIIDYLFYGTEQQ